MANGSGLKPLIRCHGLNNRVVGLILPNHHNCEGSSSIHVVHMDIKNINKCKYKSFENT
jgi:hypothetical protein